LERKVVGSSLEIREYGRRDPSCLPHGTRYPQKLALTSPTGGSHSVGIVHWWTKATLFVFVLYYFSLLLNCSISVYFCTASLHLSCLPCNNHDIILISLLLLLLLLLLLFWIVRDSNRIGFII
jgi:hypothetical protein